MATKKPSTRPAAHTGEAVQVEPLARFLERVRFEPSPPVSTARPAWCPSLEDYDLGRV